ncbi:MAG: peptidoglycan DD-metalloendopeptidase family protein [Desulfobacterales bacterium]
MLAKNWKILLLIAGQLILYTAATVGNTGGPLIPGVSAEETDDQARPESQKERQTRIEEFKTRQKNIRREIEKGRQEVEAISRREADVIKRLNQVELAYHNSKRRAALLSKEIKELDNEISAALQTSEALRRRIQANEEYVAKRLVAMYKMNWLGTIDLLASADSMQEFIQRKAALRYILAHDEKIRAEMVENRAELEKVLDRLETHKIQKSARADEYKKQMRQMAEERSLRQKLLSDIRDQKALELAAINALSQAADELDAKIYSLRAEIVNEDQDEIAPQSTFSAHKGLLIMPVNGTIISSFGPYKNQKYNVTNFRSGIDIKADKGEPIRSVFKGKVLYCDWFKGYGNMIIVDHGHNYYTVYAHLEETFKSKGDEVDAGEVIATVGDTGSLEGARLHFEVRHHGKPVDPLTWLKKG